jgi:hypothetical protein
MHDSDAFYCYVPGITLVLCHVRDLTWFLCHIRDLTLGNYKPVESFFFKDFKMECSSRSKLFKTDKNKILEWINGLKSLCSVRDITLGNNVTL